MSKRAKPPYTPKREPREPPRKDTGTNWAPGVPGNMLFVHRLYPEDHDKMLACTDWNAATGPLEMYEGSFDAFEPVGASQGETSEAMESSIDGFSSRSQSSHGYTSSGPQTPVEPLFSPYSALLRPPDGKGLPSHASGTASHGPHFHMSPGQLPLLYSKPEPVDDLRYSPTAMNPGQGFATPQIPSLLRLPTLREDTSSALDHSRGSSPGSSTSTDHARHEDLQSNACLQYPTYPDNLHALHGARYTNQVEGRQPQTLLPRSALYPVDPRQFHASGPDFRRHSLPAIPSGHHSLVPTHSQAFLGPNHSPYYASLVPPRIFPRLPEQACSVGDPRASSSLVPWPVPSLSQFPGPRRFEHHSAFPSYTGQHLGDHGIRALTSLSAVSVPMSCPSSPSRSTTLLGPGIPAAPFFTSEERPEMPKRAASWTAHFESLPAPKLGARPRKSRAKGRPSNATLDIGQKTLSQVLPPNIVLLHKCPLCPRAFEKRNGLAIHLKWHYKPVDERRESRS